MWALLRSQKLIIILTPIWQECSMRPKRLRWRWFSSSLSGGKKGKLVKESFLSVDPQMQTFFPQITRKWSCAREQTLFKFPLKAKLNHCSLSKSRWCDYEMEKLIIGRSDAKRARARPARGWQFLTATRPLCSPLIERPSIINAAVTGRGEPGPRRWALFGKSTLANTLNLMSLRASHVISLI